MPELYAGCRFSKVLATSIVLVVIFPREAQLIQKVQSIVLTGFLVGIGTVLHIAEGLLPPPIPLPGVKIGLANVVTLVALFLFGGGVASGVSLFRVILGSLFSGTFLGVAFFLSLGGGLSSLAAMYLVRGKGVSPLWVSIAGALAHNFGQWIVASFYLQSRALFFYLPVLLLLAVPSGILVGYLGMLLLAKEVVWKRLILKT